jgi:biotin synthase
MTIITAQRPETPREIRSDWTRGEILELFALPFNALLHRAHETHRRHFDPDRVQLSTLLNIKTGGCPEDCKYCSQSIHYETGLEAERLLEREEIRAAAVAAKAAGAQRFCMGAAWRELKDRDVPRIAAIVQEVRALGMETCMTLGMLTAEQAAQLKAAGLDYYNHNVDTSEEYYGEIITTRTYQDRLDTIGTVQDAGIKVCSGGIIGMGERREDRAGMIETLARLDPHPESVPINMLVPIAGTPLGDGKVLDSFEFVRTIAVARIAMPRAVVRLSAGRQALSDEAQALCFHAGANSIFYGERLLTTGNPDHEKDLALFARLDLRPTE